MSRKYLFIVIMLFAQAVSRSKANTSVKPEGKDQSSSPASAVTTTPTAGITGTTGSVQTTPTTTPTTTTTTTTTTIPTTTQAPSFLGNNCTDVTQCNSTISGGVVCDSTCKCANDHFKYNRTTCLSSSSITPTVQADPSSTTTINVTFSIGVDLTNISVTYNVTATNSSAFIYCTIESLSAFCSSLNPGTKYNISVEVRVNDTIAMNSTLASTKPALPGSLKEANHTGPNVTLEWSPSNGRVDYYTIKLHSTKYKNANSTTAEFINLQDGRLYNVTIVAFSNGLSSEANNDSFKTKVEAPDPPSNLSITNVSGNNLTLNWNRPNDTRGDLKSYQICHKSKVYEDLTFTSMSCTNTTDGSIQQKIFPTLTAGTFYYFEIQTINERFLSVDNASIDQRTNESTPGVVSNLSIMSVNDTLNVTWSRPDEPNGDVLSYKLKWLETDNITGNSCEIVLSNSSNSQLMTSVDNADCPNITIEIDMNQRYMQYEIEDLKPFTNYTIFVKAYTSVGEGPKSNLTQQTSLLKPEMVTNVQAEPVSDTEVNITWIIPPRDPGVINYTVIIWDEVYNILSKVTPCFAEDYTSTGCTQSGLQPFWKYRFTVRASNTAGDILSNQTGVIITKESNPGEVENITITLFNDTTMTSCDATKVELQWYEPKLEERRSNITRYKVQDEFEDEVISIPKTLSNVWKLGQMVIKTENIEVTAEKTFNWKIQAISSTGLEGIPSNFSFSTGNCKPPSWGNREDIVSSPPLTNGIVFRVDLTFFNNKSQGAIIDRGFVISKMKVPNLSDIQQIKDWKSSPQIYRIIPNELKQDSYQGVVSIKIGTSQCDDSTIEFCNKFLQQDTYIYLTGYVCTKGYRCTTTKTFGPFKTAKDVVDKGTPAGIIVSVVILVIVATAAAIFVGLWYRGVIDPPGWFLKNTQDEEPPLTDIVPSMSRKRPIPISRYDEALEELHRDTNLKLSDQYEDIGKISQEITERSTYTASNIEANKPKNRWVNILPYDHSRVKLQLLDDDDPTSDYVNANYMPGFSNQREYIASQGPLPSTTDDFWRMVWEQNVMVIVMLTQCKEGNRVKCEMYWPNQLREPKQYGDIVVNPISISTLDKYNISIFNVSANGHERQVTHLHYLDFPDFSANVEYDHFLDFVKTARSLVPHENEGPIIVHCSAGVGRTGTFITLDRLQNFLYSPQFSYDGQVDIFGIVISLRENRVFMVQTESQFVLIHDCFLKMLEAKKLSENKTESDDNLYANDGFDPYPEVLYENVNPRDDMTSDMNTEL